MPFWVQHTEKRVNTQYQEVGLSPAEVVELASAFRLYGFWRIDLDTGHFFATEDLCRLFGLEPQDGPVNLMAITARIHPDDMPQLMETFERASAEKLIYHNIYRVRADAEDYKYVRTVGKFRDRPGTGGEVVGLTYEFFAQHPGATFFLDEPDP
ncbi:PAS domain-containing protein [Neorhizobium sp. Rsf11]|uniref:PAS domain-containing protein n=2 Tax=Neorhizobium TaxID=1525371 RepID=A0ABV0LZT1_9HYPH|nr:PAS domain-containing protein [Neorhizobium petrolearium]MCC2610729.1 PAS domain-containing protein [Neorhizobium petrolearium]WGI70855.1 PAS domain-containing protein [Neorhizobium petrolearium]